MRRLRKYSLMIALLLGIGTGWGCHALLSADSARLVAGDFTIITDVFIRLIRMIIAPLVLSTLISGIAHMGDVAALGRIGARTLGWFLGASLVSLVLGLVMVNVLAPGEGLKLSVPGSDVAGPLDPLPLNFHDVVVHAVPQSIVEAMAQNEILQIVVFAIFIGAAAMKDPRHGKIIAQGADHVAHVMLRVTNLVMRAAPLSVFASLAAVIATRGLAVLLGYGKLIGGFYLALLLLWGSLVAAGYLLVGPRMRALLVMLREPVLLAFATASSESAYPKTLEQLERFGVPTRIASFVLPAGYSFNLDGSMLYCAFAVVFIAQAYGIALPFGTQLSMLLLLMVTSKGMAGVPRASLVVVASMLTSFNLPAAGMLLILGVDQFLDMGRSATNVIGNAVAAVAVARWERALRKAPVLSGSHQSDSHSFDMDS